MDIMKYDVSLDGLTPIEEIAIMLEFYILYYEMFNSYYWLFLYAVQK